VGQTLLPLLDELFVFASGCADLVGGGTQLDVATRPLVLFHAQRHAGLIATVAQELGLTPRRAGARHRHS
jgi:hypothetical protein